MGFAHDRTTGVYRRAGRRDTCVVGRSGTAIAADTDSRLLMPFSESNARVQARVRAFRQELAKLGWAEGSNVQFDVRWTTDEMDLVRAAAADLVWLKPDVIVTAGDRVIPVLAQLTRSIPISRGERFGRIGLRREPRAPRGERHRIFCH